jgi:hypothetical protein
MTCSKCGQEIAPTDNPHHPTKWIHVGAIINWKAIHSLGCLGWAKPASEATP